MTKRCLSVRRDYYYVSEGLKHVARRAIQDLRYKKNRIFVPEEEGLEKDGTAGSQKAVPDSAVLPAVWACGNCDPRPVQKTCRRAECIEEIDIHWHPKGCQQFGAQKMEEERVKRTQPHPLFAFSPLSSTFQRKLSGAKTPSCLLPPPPTNYLHPISSCYPFILLTRAGSLGIQLLDHRLCFSSDRPPFTLTLDTANKGIMPSIRAPLMAVRRVLSTDSEKTLVEPQTQSASHPRRCRQTRILAPTHTNTAGAGAPQTCSKTTKASIYEKKRGPLRTVIAPVASIRIFSGEGPLVLRAQRDTREPSYAAGLRDMISGVVAAKIQEEEEDERLRTFLAGRVVGGANKFGRVKLRRL
ncbi:hypothetical protein DFH06DRAFT_1127920 [Mycena polygramma]|nr:hypothetical protein DFH06DRAFT_1127920 [Mycena polygramma]